MSNGEADTYESVILNWTMVQEVVSEEWLQHKILDVTHRMADKGKVFHVTYEMIQDSPYRPREGLQRYVRLLTKALNAGKKIVGVNIFKFATLVFADTTEEWLGERFVIPRDALVDVCLLEKARQLGIHPERGEQLHDYFQRLQSERCRVCDGTSIIAVKSIGYRRSTRYPMNLTRCAGYDAMLAHLLMTEMSEEFAW